MCEAKTLASLAANQVGNVQRGLTVLLDQICGGYARIEGFARTSPNTSPDESASIPLQRGIIPILPGDF